MAIRPKRAPWPRPPRGRGSVPRRSTVCGAAYHGVPMPPDPEFQFIAEAGQHLAEALEAALEGAGDPVSVLDVITWIVDGRVQVAGQVVRDPHHELQRGESVELAPWAGPPTSASEPIPHAVPEILHLDPQVLVVEYAPPPVSNEDAETVPAYLGRLLVEAGFDGHDPVPVPDHEPRASGLVCAGLEPRGNPTSQTNPLPFGVRVTMKAIVEAAPDADVSGLTVARELPGALLVRTRPSVSSLSVRADLEKRGLRVLEVNGEGPPGTRPLHLHVAGIALTQPLTGQTLMFACKQPAAFTAALDVPTRSRT